MRRRLGKYASPFVGALAAAAYFFALHFLSRGASTSIAGLVDEFWRRLSIYAVASYLIFWPPLLLAEWLGLKSRWHFAALSGLCATPWGYVYADPASFAFTLTDADFAHGPYWSVMWMFVLCFCLMGYTYATGIAKRKFRDAPNQRLERP